MTSSAIRISVFSVLTSISIFYIWFFLYFTTIGKSEMLLQQKLCDIGYSFTFYLASFVLWMSIFCLVSVFRKSGLAKFDRISLLFLTLSLLLTVYIHYVIVQILLSK